MNLPAQHQSRDSDRTAGRNDLPGAASDAFAIEGALRQPLQPEPNSARPVTAAIEDLSLLKIRRGEELVAVVPVTSARPGLRGRGTWTSSTPFPVLVWRLGRNPPQPRLLRPGSMAQPRRTLRPPLLPCRILSTSLPAPTTRPGSFGSILPRPTAPNRCPTASTAPAFRSGEATTASAASAWPTGTSPVSPGYCPSAPRSFGPRPFPPRRASQWLRHRPRRPGANRHSSRPGIRGGSLAPAPAAANTPPTL